MNRCRCCGTNRDPNLGKRVGPYRPSYKCAYCSGFPRTDHGRCWGLHGSDLQRYLQDMVSNCKLSAEAAAESLLQERLRLEQPWL